MPVLEGLHNQYSQVAVLGILLDPQRLKWAQLTVQETGTTFPHLKDDGRFAQQVYAVPETILVDRNGRILEVLVGLHSQAQFSEYIEKYLQ